MNETDAWTVLPPPLHLQEYAFDLEARLLDMARRLERARRRAARARRLRRDLAAVRAENERLRAAIVNRDPVTVDKIDPPQNQP